MDIVFTPLVKRNSRMTMMVMAVAISVLLLPSPTDDPAEQWFQCQILDDKSNRCGPIKSGRYLIRRMSPEPSNSKLDLGLVWSTSDSWQEEHNIKV